MEKWKDVTNYVGLYQVSDLGNIKNKIGTLLKISKDGRGYSHVTLYKNGIKKTQRIHPVVMNSFIGNRPFGPDGKKMEINHKDGIKINNRLDNLEYCTKSENIKHAFDILGHKTVFNINHPMEGRFGENHISSKRVKQQNRYGKTIKIWGSITDIQNKLGIDISNISKCCRGKRNIAGGFKWVYINS